MIGVFSLIKCSGMQIVGWNKYLLNDYWKLWGFIHFSVICSNKEEVCLIQIMKDIFMLLASDFGECFCTFWKGCACFSHYFKSRHEVICWRSNIIAHFTLLLVLLFLFAIHSASILRQVPDQRGSSVTIYQSVLIYIDEWILRCQPSK